MGRAAAAAPRCRRHRDRIGIVVWRLHGGAGPCRYNRWADANRIIVLYPQAIARWWWVYNPNGCWDWWGYTGAQYHTKEGAQIRAVIAMLSRLGEPPK